MTHISTKRATIALILAPGLLLGTAPVAAATPDSAKAKPPVLTCNTTTPEGLSYTVIKAGKGEKPGADAKVKVNYKGMLTSDGSMFDSGEGTEFKVSAVISGFAQGLQLMQPGSSFRFCIPSKLGYGANGSGPIPANADLVFEVDLLSFTLPQPKPVIPVAERTCDKTTESGLRYFVIQSGTGKTPTTSDMALVDFATFDAKTGVTQDQREWEKITLAQATPVFVEALKLMKGGSSYTFCIPQPKTEVAKDVSAPEINIKLNLIDVRPAPELDF